MELPVVNHPDYVAQINEDNKFPIKKFGALADYLIKEGEQRIPVEVKTGRRPKAPFFSHVLQIGAYCLLSEETFLKSPSHGQIRYGFENEPHHVEWEPKLKTLVIEKIEEMNDILDGKMEAHRNHKRAGKCYNCSRRKGCPERLKN